MRVPYEMDIELWDLWGAWGTSWSDERPYGDSNSPSGALCIE